MTEAQQKLKKISSTAPQKLSRWFGRVTSEIASVGSELTNDQVRVSVLTGRHKGAVANVNSGRMVIGSSTNADIVITDEGIADEHVRVTARRNWWSSQIEVQSLNGTFVVGYQVPNEAGSLIVNLPADVVVGSTRIRFESTVPRNELWTSGRGLMMAIFIGAALGLILPFLPVISGSIPTFWSPAASQSQVSSVDGILQQLSNSGLVGKVHVSERWGTFIFRGTLPVGEYEKWRAVKRQLLAQGLTVEKMVDLVGSSTAGRTRQKIISAVVMDPEPMVIAYNGRKARVGELLVDGWVVKEISGDVVLLQRGQQSVRVRW